MKPPSKKIWAALIAAIVIVAVISVVTGRNTDQAQRRADSNVVFINDSNAAVGSVGYSFSRYDGTLESGGACNADGSLLKRGDKFWLDVQFPCTLTVYADVEGRKPVAVAVLEHAPPKTLQEGLWYVIARDGDNGVPLTLSLNLDEKDVEKMKDIVSDELGVDVSGGEISYCWYPGHGIQGDGEDFVVLQFSQQAGAALAETLSTGGDWQFGQFPAELKEKTFESVYSHVSHIDWSRVSDSGWFYYRDEKKTDSDSPYNVDLTPYRSSDYVAAVYDPESRTLYFFEWHQ